MPNSPPSSLVAMEARLRHLLPATLYAAAWTNPTPDTLTQVFEHLRTLQYILLDYVPRHLAKPLSEPGAVEFEWEEGTLMFTDLAGFTRLLEANAVQGGPGAEMVLSVLNSYFAGMIEIISKSGGSLLEFTGDAMLVQFRDDRQQSDCAKAIRAGLRMQRAMAKFTNIQTPQGDLSLGMRIGLHTGRFLTAHIGTPKRMEHVLLGSAVQRSKHAEGSGKVGRVCVTETIVSDLAGQFRFEEGPPGYKLVVDDFTEEELGEYEIAAPRTRKGHTILFDRSVPGLIHEIGETLKKVEPLASYLPSSILTLLVESAARREIRPEFVDLVAMFVNILGLSERIEELPTEEQANLVIYFSRLFALINAAVLAQGGVLKNVTYHLVGSDMLIYFGVPNGHVDDPARAAEASLMIREIVRTLPPLVVNGVPVPITCQVGVARGFAFAAEIGEPRGRREFNVLGDSVNIAARLMSRAGENQILIDGQIAEKIKERFVCESLGPMTLKGKVTALPVFALKERKA